MRLSTKKTSVFQSVNLYRVVFDLPSWNKQIWSHYNKADQCNYNLMFLFPLTMILGVSP